MKAYKITDKTGNMVAIKFVNEDDDLLVITDDGTIIRVNVADIGEKGRSTQGSRIMRPAPGAKVISIEKTDKEIEEKEIEDELTEEEIANASEKDSDNLQ